MGTSLSISLVVSHLVRQQRLAMEQLRRERTAWSSLSVDSQLSLMELVNIKTMEMKEIINGIHQLGYSFIVWLEYQEIFVVLNIIQILQTISSRPMRIQMLVLFAVAVIQVQSMKMILYLGQNEGPKCFYEYLKNDEKYAFNIKGFTHQKFKIDIYREAAHKWEEVYTRESPTSFESIHKLAQAQATHMFCIANLEEGILKAQVEIMGGLELGSLEALPSKGDHELLDQQIGWLEHQKEKLIQAITRVGETQQSSQELKASSNKTLLFLAILGLLAVVGINYFFFTRAKGVLRERKLI